MKEQEEAISMAAAGENKSRVAGCHSHFVSVEESKPSSREGSNFHSMNKLVGENEKKTMESVSTPNTSIVGPDSPIRGNRKMKDGCLKGLLGHGEKLEQSTGVNAFKEKSTVGFYEDASLSEDIKKFLKESVDSLRREGSVCLNNLESQDSMELSEALALSKPLDFKKARAPSEGLGISAKLSASDPRDQQQSLFEVRGAASFADDIITDDRGGLTDGKSSAPNAGEKLSKKSSSCEIKEENFTCREGNCSANGDTREAVTACQRSSSERVSPESCHNLSETHNDCKSILYEDRVVVSPQDENAHQKLMSGSLLGLWKKRGRPPNHVKHMLIQQALGSDCPDVDPLPRSQTSGTQCGDSLASQRTKRRRTQRVHTSYSTSDEDSAPELMDEEGIEEEGGGEAEEEENPEVEEEEMYGCSKCNYSWDGCGTCRSGKPVATRSKARWDPSNPHHQVVPSAPVYHPTYEEFQNPVEYLNKIRPEAEKYGICMIVPPQGWNPPLPSACINDDFSFSVKKQITDSLCIRPLRTAEDSNPSSPCKQQGSSRMGPSCHGQVDEFGFDVLDDPISMKSFRSYTEWASVMHFADGCKEKMPKLSITDIEGEFWRIVEDGSIPVDVLYGSDLDTGELGSGFPVSKGSNNSTTGEQVTCGNEDVPSMSNHHEQYRSHPWNINSWPQNENSVLRHIIGDELITGVMVPWLYVGSCMSAFCWHVEDHFLYSVNYLHAGAEKIWYGVPSAAATDFEAAMKDALPHLFKADPNLLHRLVTHLSPNELIRRGVPVHRLEHKPGSFVITFPNAYHGGFNSGWNFAEAVNFAPPDWLPHGTDATLKYRMQAKSTTFSNDALLVTLVEGLIARHNKSINPCQKCVHSTISGSLDEKAVMYALGELVLRIEVEEQQQKIAGLCGIAQVIRMYGNKCTKDDKGLHTNTFDVDCDVCKADLYLSSVVSRHVPGRAVCPEHTSHLPGPRIMLVRYTIRELQYMTSEAVNILSQSREYIQAAQIRSKSFTHSKLILHGPFKGSIASEAPPEDSKSVLGKRKAASPSISDLTSKRRKGHDSLSSAFQVPTLNGFMAPNMGLVGQLSGGTYSEIPPRPASQNTWSSLHVHALPIASLSLFAPLAQPPGLIPNTSSSTTAGQVMPAMSLPFLSSLQLPTVENMKSVMSLQFPSTVGETVWPQGTVSQHVTQLVPPIPSVLQQMEPTPTQIVHHSTSDVEEKQVQSQTGTTPRGLIENAGPLISISPVYIGKVAGNSLPGGESSQSGVAKVIDISLCDTATGGFHKKSDSALTHEGEIATNKQCREAEINGVVPSGDINTSSSHTMPHSASSAQIPSESVSAPIDCGQLPGGSNEDPNLQGCKRIREFALSGGVQMVERNRDQSVERDKANDCSGGQKLGSIFVPSSGVALSDSGKDAMLLVPT